MKTVSAFVCGLLFGVGLIVSSMVNPAKVLGFLDVTGLWDPSLVFVMIGGIAVALVGFGWAKSRQQSLLGLPMHIPARRDIDRRLVLGSMVFGVGWGIAGFCPGPALVALGSGNTQALIFVGAMLCGMALFTGVESVSRRKG